MDQIENAKIRARWGTRRWVAVGSATAAVAVLAVGVVVTVARHDATATATPVRPAATPAGAPTASRPDAEPSWILGLPVGAPIKADIVSGDSLYTADGRRLRVSLPPDERLDGAQRALGGWVVESAPTADRGGTLWYLSSTGQARRLVGGLRSGWTVERGGAAVYVGGEQKLRRMALPSGRVTATVAGRNYHSPIAATPGLVLVVGGTGGEGPPPAAVWDVAAGRIVDARTPIQLRQILPDGRLLVGVATEYGIPENQCLAVVALSARMTPTRRGLCSTSITWGAVASPDGMAIALSRVLPDEASVVEIRDLQGALAGQTEPVSRLRVSPETSSRIAAWEGVDHVLLYDVSSSDPSHAPDRLDLLVVRCAVRDGSCERAPLPRGVPTEWARLVE